MRKILERDGITLPPNATFADALGSRMFLLAIAGDCAAAREIREAIEGKAGYRIEPQDDVNREVVLTVNWNTGPKLNKTLMAERAKSKEQEGAAETPPPPPSP